MKYLLIISSILFSMLCGISLQEVFDNANPANNYDKYIELDNDITYTGGIGIFEGNIYIDCNEAIIDLEDGNGIWIYADEEFPSSLEIKNCSIINGLYYGISFGGSSIGDIKNCNFLDTNFGIKMFDYSDVEITNCIFGYQQTYGIGIYTENPILDLTYSLFWENVESDCMESCPG